MSVSGKNPRIESMKSIQIFKESGIRQSFQDKLDLTKDLWERYRAYLAGDKKLAGLLAEYRRCIQDSARTMKDAGIVEICARCDQEEGGSCCGNGIELRYNAVLLLLNLLLGAPLQEEKLEDRSCHFLGESGCTLTARQVLCVNYLCRQIVQTVPKTDIIHVQEVCGTELDFQHRVYEYLANRLRKTESVLGEALDTVQRFYDSIKVGVSGNEGERKSTDLASLARCIPDLVKDGLIDPRHTIFLDMGCADGRVNVWMSYWVRTSLGIELDGELLANVSPLLSELSKLLQSRDLPPPPDRIRTRVGDSLKDATYDEMKRDTGFGFADIDVFYTHFTLHDVFADKIARQAKAGAVYLVYGLDRVVPRYPGLRALTSDRSLHGVLGVYQKEG